MNELYKFSQYMSPVPVKDNEINDPMIMTEEEFIASESERKRLQEERLNPTPVQYEKEEYDSLCNLTTGEHKHLHDIGLSLDQIREVAKML